MLVKLTLITQTYEGDEVSTWTAEVHDDAAVEVLADGEVVIGDNADA